jgi:hypothetical protein
MNALKITLGVLFLTACAVLDYKPQIRPGGANDQRITQDLQECKELAKHAAVNGTQSNSNQFPIKDRFQRAYDNCMRSRGHKIDPVQPF